MKTKCRSPDFQDNVNLITWLLGFGNACIDGIWRKKTTEISVKQPFVTSHRFSRKWNQKLQENTSLILFVTGIRWQIIMYKSQQSNTSRIQRTEQALLFCFSPRCFLIVILIFCYFSIANTLSGLILPQLNCFTNEFFGLHRVGFPIWLTKIVW